MSRLERKNSFLKKMAIFMVFNMVFEIVAPTAAMALTSGPSSPEFGSFEPVATNNMVDPFTGDFTYNLPVLMVPGTNGGGYPISLSYHSGTTGEQEASWVGHGWTLNPGAINRGKQGFPDDWNGETVVNHNKSIPNVTVTAGVTAGAEVFSMGLPVDASAKLTYNNYKGFGYSTGAGLSLAKGFISLGFNITDGQSAFSLKVNPWKLINKEKQKERKIKRKLKSAERQKSRTTEKKNHAGLKKFMRNAGVVGMSMLKSSTSGSVYGALVNSKGQRPNQVNDYTGFAANFSISFIPTVSPLPVGAEIGFTGSVALQKNIPITTNAVYGNYYNQNAYTDDNSLMDYYTEKQHSYENNDIFLGIPHSLADQYMVTGEGIGGAFRMHHKTVGQYRPNKVNSEIIIGNVGLEFDGGLNNGTGFDVAVGYHNYKQKGWELYDGVEEYSDENKSVFRFSNDLGGSVAFDNDEVEESALLHKNNGVPGFKKYSANTSYIDQSINSNISPADYGIGSSSYIGYNTIAQRNMTSGTVHYNAYEKSPEIGSFVDFNEEAIRDQIGELSVKNKSGESYNYGLPVFARNEREISVGTIGVNPTVENGYLAYGDIGINTAADRNALRIIQGQERNAPYVTSYLLTSIYESNYIDRTNNGPSEDDFGGYTQFGYKQAHGSSNGQSKTTAGDWYHWRFPYTGMYYNRGRLSDKKDDLVSYSSGQKEVYYLENIETKTHIAVFNTSDRSDGRSAHNNNDQADHDQDAMGDEKLQKLDKIELFVKDLAWETYITSDIGGGVPDPSLKPAPLKTVNFEYDYSLVPGIPNSDAGEGKLTLKRVWFDYNGIYKAQISPYEFEYNYPDYTTYPDKYKAGGADDVTAGYANFNGAAAQVENPNYDEQQLNAWGYNQGTEIGQAAHDRMKPWLDQRQINGEDLPDLEFPTDPPYDPAAWNLKNIKLPSGGEIHVQYEQDDYQYVQDKLAHVMVPLLDDLEGSQDGNSPRYYLNTDAIDVNTDEEKLALVDAITKLYIQGKQKIYFKMLYSMSPLNTAPSPQDCDVEYITGYLNVEDAHMETTGSHKVYIDLVTGQPDRFDLPKKVCKEYEKAFLSGKSLDQNCGIDGDLTFEDSDDQNIITQFIDMLPDIPTPGVSIGCAYVDWENSYFRVPSVKSKKGGGLRVKRLMMYTPALHAGEQPELYGTEYEYKFRDADGKIKSSGVATNEPAAIREENILVDNIDRLPKNEWDKLRDLVTAGKEKEKFEGPIGESLYGSASVGYSQVITKSIHSGKTNTGYSVNQFHTCKDFPMVSDFTDLAGNTKNDYLPIPALWFNQVTNNVWAAQGYHFTINNMHGQMKRVAAYTGDYANVVDPFNGNLVSATEYDYFKVGDEVPVMNSLEEIENLPLGKESEMYMESKSVTDHMHDVSAEFDVNVGVFGTIPVPMGSLFPSYSHVETELHTHVTNKVTRYPAIVRSVRNYTDGIWSKSENLAFNSQTGDPLITRTYDDFNDSDEGDQFEINNADHYGWFTSYAIPAYQEYANMGQIALNEGKVYGSGTDPMGYMIDKFVDPSDNSVTLSFYSAAGPIDVCDATKQLTAGDLIHLIGTAELYHIAAINGTNVNLVPTYYNTLTPTSATNIMFKVIRSGRTNQASANVGSFVTYGKSTALNSTLPEITTVALDDPTHPQNAEYTDRLAFVASLNGTLAGLGGPILLPPGMFVNLDDPATCWEESDLEMSMSYSEPWITISSGIGTTDCNSHLTQIPGGEFHLNPDNGALFYGLASGDCNPQSVECLIFCEQLFPIKTVQNVITASASSLSDNWDYDEAAYDNGITNYNDYESGKRGKWRTKSTYAYKSTTTGLEARFNPFSAATSDEEFNYNSGVFTMALFNWKYLDANNPNTWLKAATVTKYSPNGNALEEQNILGIKSTVKFGYNEYLPYLVASNSPYESVLFESFENVYGLGANVLEDNQAVAAGTTVSTDASHTGYSALKFASGSTASFFTTNEMEFTDQIANVGLHTKLWIKDLDANTETIQVTITDALTGDELYGDLIKVAQTGEWTLYELNYSAWGAFNPENFTISFNIENSVSGKDFYVDDIRIQPMDTEMACYVYDYKNYRLMATFDDQHFSMRYQYNDEGQLIRKQIETTRGIKTVTDGQYNTPLKNRTN